MSEKSVFMDTESTYYVTCVRLTRGQALCPVRSLAELRPLQALGGPGDGVSYSDDGWKILSPFKM